MLIYYSCVNLPAKYDLKCLHFCQNYKHHFSGIFWFFPKRLSRALLNRCAILSEAAYSFGHTTFDHMELTYVQKLSCFDTKFGMPLGWSILLSMNMTFFIRWWRHYDSHSISFVVAVIYYSVYNSVPVSIQEGHAKMAPFFKYSRMTHKHCHLFIPKRRVWLLCKLWNRISV